MAFLFAMGIIAICFPGVGSAAVGVVGEAAMEGVLSRRKLAEIERLIFLGLPVEPSDAEKVLSSLTLWEIDRDDLPLPLQYIAGEYVFNDIEMSRLMDAVRHIDISENLGGNFAKEFDHVVKKGPKGKEFRTSFQTHGVDIGKILTHGRRRLEDQQIRRLLGLEEKVAA